MRGARGGREYCWNTICPPKYQQYTFYSLSLPTSASMKTNKKDPDEDENKDDENNGEVLVREFFYQLFLNNKLRSQAPFLDAK